MAKYKIEFKTNREAQQYLIIRRTVMATPIFCIT